MLLHACLPSSLVFAKGLCCTRIHQTTSIKYLANAFKTKYCIYEDCIKKTLKSHLQLLFRRRLPPSKSTHFLRKIIGDIYNVNFLVFSRHRTSYIMPKCILKAKKMIEHAYFLLGEKWDLRFCPTCSGCSEIHTIGVWFSRIF